MFQKIRSGVGVQTDPRRKRLGCWPRLVILVLAFVSLHGGRAASQQPAAPLPSVTYPGRDPDTAPPPGNGMTEPQPPPSVIVVVPDTYYWFGGAWGYWDRRGNFHRAGTVARSTTPRLRSAPQYAAGLSNFRSSTIVGGTLGSRERGIVR